MDQHVSLKVLVPDGTTNYVQNPSFRYDTTGWGAQGATLTRTLAQARFNMASGQVVTNGAALYEGVYFRVSALSGISEAVTVSAYVRGNGAVRIRLDDNSVGGAEYPSQAVQLLEGRWTRISVTGRSHGGDDLRLYVETAEDSAAVRTFYVDGAQLERKPYLTSYCDGDQDKCRWNGIYHASSSTRPSTTRAGGRWVELSGPQREAEDLYMTVAGGLGVAPLSNNMQNFALEPGGYHQSVKIEMRAISLTFHAKNRALFRDRPVTLERLHDLRQMLIDVVKPDRTMGDEDIWFEYNDGEVPLYFRARYDGGLEGEWDVRNGWVNSFPLRLLAVTPFLEEDEQESEVIDYQETIYPNYVAGRIDGKWNILNYGFNGNVTSMVKGPRGEIYAVGGFTVCNNNAAAIDPLLVCRGVAKWDGEKWVPLVTIGGSVGVSTIAIAPNGYIYVGGTFTSINGVAASRLAYYDGSNWNAMGAGLTLTAGSARCNALLADAFGNVWVGGSFDSAGGVTCHSVARWDGSIFHRLGDYGGLDDEVFSLEISQDHSILYVGGEFLNEEGLAGDLLKSVTSYDTSTGKFSAMGNGLETGTPFSAIVYSILRTKSNRLLAGGTFKYSGTDPIDYIAEFVGNNWVDLGSNATSLVENISELGNNVVYLTGGFVSVGGAAKAGGLALYLGSTFVPLDINTGTGQTDAAVSNDDSDDIFVGLYAQTAANSFLKGSGITTVNNPGTAACHPKFYIRGSGRLRWIENQTTKQRLYFDLDIVPNEEIMIDTDQGTILSNLRTSLFFKMLPGSDFGNFSLAPGENRLACFIFDDVDAQMSIQFVPRHWSADAGGGGENL